uniref:RRM domain-containing protein n=1 Tax=Physcomitrium patens TaxID=3218 RepID=A0A7I4A7R3_PHYPA
MCSLRLQSLRTRLSNGIGNILAVGTSKSSKAIQQTCREHCVWWAEEVGLCQGVVLLLAEAFSTRAFPVCLGIQICATLECCTSADITAFFKGMQVVADGIFLCTHADGRPTGEAFVEFVNEETAARAMQLHREPMGSRYVELFRSTKGEMMTAVQQRMYGMFSGAGGFSQFGVGQIPGMMGAFGVQGLTGMNLAAVQAAGLGSMTVPQGLSDTSEHVCIKMRGLPYNAGQREIMDFFEGYSFLPNGIHIVMGATDRPTGEAFVEFMSSDEAQRAMERHRQNIGSRYIELFRATKSEMLLATGGLSSFGMGQPMDPSVQLLLLQQQAAAGAFGMTGLMGAQASTGSWVDMQNAAAAAASFYQRQAAGLTGSPASVSSFEPSSSAKIRGLPYRTST